MKQYCPKCEDWRITDKKFCPKCGAVMKSENEYAQFINNISNNTSRLTIEDISSECQESSDDTNQDVNDISLLNKLLSEILKVNKKQFAKQSKIYDDLHFIKTVVKVFLILDCIVIAIYLITLLIQ